MPRLIAYYRVSTAKQGASGLGLDAQRTAVATHLRSTEAHLLAEYTEVESGANRDRPQLAEALRSCQLRNCTLVIARLDRLARDVGFISRLRDAGIRFVCCDMPTANNFTVNIMASLAEYERELISTRVRQAMQRAKAQGRRFGNPNLSRTRSRTSTVEATAARVRNSEEFSARVAKMVETMGSLSFRQVAARLNDLEVVSPSGRGKWHPTTVSRMLERAKSRPSSA